jgi:D-tyrosyl-tRNA(Tyr) deacylase
MRALLQRVAHASVTVDGRVAGSIGPGLLILLGVRRGDTPADADFLARKSVELRIFPDSEGKLNESAFSKGYEVLIVSQFTLYASVAKGRRPGFEEAAPADQALPLYRRFVQQVQASGLRVAEGVFQADMQVALVNDGPVTILCESSGRDV